MHAVALGMYPDRGFSVVDFTTRVSPPAKVPQPPLYMAGGSDSFNHPLKLVGSKVEIPTLRYDPGGTREQLFGTEISEGRSGRQRRTQSFQPELHREHGWGARGPAGGGRYLGFARTLESPAHPHRAMVSDESPLALPDMTCVDQPLVVASESVANRARELDLSFSIDHTYDSDLKCTCCRPPVRPCGWSGV